MMASARSLDAGAQLSATVCIIGAGAAGITLACELDRSGIDTLLVDAGAPGRRGKVSQDPYHGSTSELHPKPSNFRRLGFGGSTTIWGGRCVPFDPIDFEARDYVPGSGWPIGHHEVARHYPRALEYCDAGGSDFDAASAIARARPTFPGAPPEPQLLTQLIERYSLPTDFGARNRQRLERSRNVRVLTHAHCVRLLRGAAGRRIAGARFARPDRTTIDVAAQVFVVATGGIETPRLLLASDPYGPGLGNHAGHLGRYYMCHVENIFGVIRAAEPGTVFDFERTVEGVYCRRKLRLHDAAQRRHRLLNTVFRLHFPDVSDPAHRSAVLSAVYLAKRALIPEHRRILQYEQADRGGAAWRPHLANVARGLPALAGFGARWLFRRTLAHRKLPYVLTPNADGSFPLEFNAEQTPLAASRITLARDCDRYGVPRVHVDWRMCEADVDSACRSYELLRTSLGPQVRLEYDAAAMRERLARSVPVGGHHIGTARMSARPADGVVDPDGAVHGLDNLYVASSAVFPTCSHANPTLTIVALALRMAEHLRRRAAHGGHA